MTDTHTTKAAIVAAPPTTDALDRADRDRMHPLVRLAMGMGVEDVATLKELVALQRESEAADARRAYTTAMVGLKAALPRVLAHDKEVRFKEGGKSEFTHTSLAAAVDAVVEILGAHGFTHAWQTSMTTDNKVHVACRLTHAMGHYEENWLCAPPDTKGNKTAPQAVASTVTLLSRYTLLALLGIATADMKEPTQAESDPAGVNGKRNRAAMRAMLDVGFTADECAALCDGRTVQQWTAADLETLGAEHRRRKAHASGELTEEEERAMEAERG